MKREFKKDGKGALCLVTSVEIDKEKELSNLQQNIDSVTGQIEQLTASLAELKVMRDDLAKVTS